MGFIIAIGTSVVAIAYFFASLFIGAICFIALIPKGKRQFALFIAVGLTILAWFSLSIQPSDIGGQSGRNYKEWADSWTEQAAHYGIAPGIASIIAAVCSLFYGGRDSGT